jgi:hypothetical protein
MKYKFLLEKKIVNLPSFDRSFKIIKEDYAETEFCRIITDECIYSEAYVNL